MCLTCGIAAGKIVPVGGIIYKDDYVVLHHCIDVNIAGYLIISPVRHVEEYSGLNVTEIIQIGTVMKAAAAILSEMDGIEKIYLANFGEETAHFHMHIFPRYKWMLNCSAEDIHTDNKIDGAKLLSIYRKRFKVERDAMDNDYIINVVEGIRNRLVVT